MTTTTWRTTREAEQTMLALAGRTEEGPAYLATHFAGGAVLVTAESRAGAVEVVGGGLATSAGEDLAALHRERRGGRVFRFPGLDALTGTTTVAEVLQDTAIDDVVMVGHREPLTPDAVLDTQDFVRPHFRDGRLVLVVRPAADGVVTPFEQPNPTPCCTNH